MRAPNKFPHPWLLFFFFLLQIAVGFLALDGKTLSFDESIWHYIGRNWFSYGFTPYEGGVDNKSPFIFAIYGFSDYLFGTNFWFPRLMGAIVQTLGILFLYRLMLKIADKNAGIIAVIIYGLSLAWKSTGGKYISYTESYEICLLLAAFYYFFKDDRKKSPFISGCFAGFSVFFRLTGALGAFALFVAALRKSKTSVLHFALGLISATVVSLSIIALAGISLKDYFFYGILDNFGEGSVSGRTALWKLESLINGFFLSDLVLFIPGIAGYILIRKKLDAFVLWLAFAFIGLNLIGLYARQHFRDLLPPMCIMTALSIHYLAQQYQLRMRTLFLIIWISFFPKHIEPILAFKNLVKPGSVKPKVFCVDTNTQLFDEDKRKLGEWIENNSVISEKVYIGGMSAVVQVYANRISPTIYFNSTQTSNAVKRTIEDLARNKPDFILIPGTDSNMNPTVKTVIAKMIAQNYRYEGCQFNYAVYRLVEP